MKRLAIVVIGALVAAVSAFVASRRIRPSSS